MEHSEEKYTLKIEILEDEPKMSLLKKGQICMAHDNGSRYDVVDDREESLTSNTDWAVPYSLAKVIT